MDSKEFEKYVKSGVGIGILIFCIFLAFLFPIPAIILVAVCKVSKGLK